MTLLRPQSGATQGTGDAAKSAGRPWPGSLDAVQAAPRHHHVVFENDRVRVLDTQVAPGDTAPIHTHRWPAVNHINGWSDFMRRDAKGRVLVDTRGRPPPATLPLVVWSEPLPPHTLENVGPAELRVVSIEIKDAAAVEPAPGS